MPASSSQRLRALSSSGAAACRTGAAAGRPGRWCGRRVPSRAMAVRLHQLERQPGRDGEGDGQRQRHAQAGVDRDRAHVRPHQAADEGHGQQRRDHRQRGQDGGAADLVHRQRDDLAQRLARVELLVAVDVLHHHDGVVDQDADREDQREQLTRLSVKPQAQLANSVAVSVRITAAPTITASRRPSARPTSRITEPVAKASFWISLLAFSAAVSP
jgi:hypothetical protein